MYGVSGELPALWPLQLAQGRFYAAAAPGRERAQAVLGHTLHRELFGHAPAVGARVRVGGEGYRVAGVLAHRGRLLGFDLDDALFIPTGRALALFDREGLMEIDLRYRAGLPVDRVAERVRERLIARHGQEDFSLTTQQQMLDVLGSLLDQVRLAVQGLAGISLLVGAVGIYTVMTIAVQERAAEIGLLRALGATRRRVLALFLLEAGALAVLGGLLGLLIGLGGCAALALWVPALPLRLLPADLLLAQALAGGIGMVAGVLPARAAAALEPVAALEGAEVG